MFQPTRLPLLEYVDSLTASGNTCQLLLFHSFEHCIYLHFQQSPSFLFALEL